MAKTSNLTKRLHAWWKGEYFEEELELEPEVELVEKTEAEGLGHMGRDSAIWSDPRVQMSEGVWGTGFTSPGGEEQVVELIRPLGLDSSMMIVDIGAGLGGTTRALQGLGVRNFAACHGRGNGTIPPCRPDPKRDG